MSEAKEFGKMLDDMDKECGFYSMTPFIKESSAFKQVVYNGRAILPAIFDKLKKDDCGIDLLLALSEITGTYPLINNPGIVKEIKEWWIKWGREQGYLK